TKKRLGVSSDPEIPAADLRKLVDVYKDVVVTRTNAPFPQDPREQLRLAVRAVFDSWYGKKAVEYRRINTIPADWGTAVTVMSMVFGNLGETSGTGVGFTRDPRTGERGFYAEFLDNAQGEDVVAGIRTPEHIEDLQRRMPKIYDELLAIADRLERHYKDMQDIEFTIQEGKLYLLQTRAGKRSAAAAVKVAVDLVHEAVIDQHTALLRVNPRDLARLFVPLLDPHDKQRALAGGRLLARGLPAAPGGAVGQVVFGADRAGALAKDGQRVRPGGPRVGGPLPQARRARERRHAGGRGARPRVRRRGHRARAHRAHVLRRRPDPDRARYDHGLRSAVAAGRARQAPAVPAGGLHRDLPRHGWAARHHPAAGPAAARVPREP